MIGKITILGFVCICVQMLNATGNEEKSIDTEKKINRTLPVVTPQRKTEISKSPTDKDVTGWRIFSIPLKSTESKHEDNSDLANAVKAYAGQASSGDFTSLQNYVDSHPDSKWNVSLLVNLGDSYFNAGQFDLAMAAWKKAWEIGKNEKDGDAKSLADYCIGNLAKMNARVGRVEEIKAILSELKGRALSGPATEMVTGAAEGLWLMQNRPERAFLCGPLAVQTLYRKEQPNKIVPSAFGEMNSSSKGTSLAQIEKLAEVAGMNYQMAWKEKGAQFIVPSIVNWKIGHWAALTESSDGRVLADDPTFGQRLWVKEEILDQETSGYFLVPAGALPRGWRIVNNEEGSQVWGKGTTSSTDPDNCKPCDEKSSSAGCAGCGEGTPSAAGHAMAVASGHLAVVSLNIVDVPLFYTPPRGPSVAFRLTYNQRDGRQAPSFSYSNFGPKWTCDWISYVIDDPNNLLADVTLYVQGGGAETYKGFTNSIPSSSAPSLFSQSTLARKTASSYELQMSDGSIRKYEVSDGSTGSTRRVFLTKIIDAQGNALTLTYDFGYNSYPRIVALTDALSQVTTIAYNDATDPLKITSITDPFGRTASFGYTGGQLTSITDMIGIVSQFGYDATSTNGDFINSLTTPYGTSWFSYGGSGRTRWLEMMDPMGAKERIEYNERSDIGIPYSLPSNTVPNVSGMSNVNNYIYARNTFYWSKKAMMMAPGDYSQARLFHWQHFDSYSVSGGILESSKEPNENRVWYNYPDQGSGWFEGSSNRPSIIARILDDGVTTQVYRNEYNASGKIRKEVDPLNRVKTYKYAANNIDLLEVYQENPSGTTLDEYGVAADKLFTYSDYVAHQPQTVFDASGQKTTYTYDPSSGQKLTETVRRNNVDETTTWVYTAGYLTSVTGPVAGATTSYTYDAIGRVKTITDSTGYKITNSYDALNRINQVFYPDGTWTQTVYDKLDPVWEKDRLGRWTHRQYDALRRVTAVTDPENQTVHYDWCSCGSLEGIYVTGADRVSFEQDVQGRLTKKTYPDNTSLIYTYETTTSRLKSTLDGKSQTTTYNYFIDNTPQNVVYTGAQYATPTVNYTYSPYYQRVATMTDGTGLTQYAYNPVGSPNPSGSLFGANKLYSIDGPLSNDTVVYSYDELGRVLGTSINGTGNIVSFDALGRMATAANPLGSFTYHYVNQTPRLSSIDRPGGQSVVYSYYGNSNDQRLSEIKNLGPLATLTSKFNYTYDTVGNILNWTQQFGSASPQYYDLGYNGTDELLTANLKDVATKAMIAPYTYTYDAAGNRLSEQADYIVATSGYNNLNQLKTISGGGKVTLEGTVSEPSTVTSSGNKVPVDVNNRFKATVQTVNGSNSFPIVATDGSGNVTSKTAQIYINVASKTLNYDLNGNLTYDGSKTYEWDAANRLLAINYTGTTNRSEFTYDGQGRNVQIVEKIGSLVVKTKKFVWTGNQRGEERDASNNITKRFYSEGEQINGTSYLFNKDHLGSVVEMVEIGGTVQQRYAYDPFGRRTSLAGGVDSDFGFTGHYYHSPSALHMALYRGYSANLGRWLSRDPITNSHSFFSIAPSRPKPLTQVGEIMVGANLYAYCDNNVINETNPSGLLPGLEGPYTYICQGHGVDTGAKMNMMYRSKKCDPDKASKCCDDAIAAYNAYAEFLNEMPSAMRSKAGGSRGAYMLALGDFLLCMNSSGL